MRYDFGSDNTAGMAPAALQALVEANEGYARAYGADDVTARAADQIRRRLDAPLAADTFHVPETRTIDLPLAGGAALFGLGWGLVGLCPGPALAALTTGAWQALVFVPAVVAGMALFRLTLGRET